MAEAERIGRLAELTRGTVTSGVVDAAAEEAVRAMRERNPEADPQGRLPDVHPTRIPRHIAIIMDGNGRWAAQRGLERVFGHRNGAIAVRRIVTEAAALGVEALTLYSFSSENWKRPEAEISALMLLCEAYCDGERDELVKRNIRVRMIGGRDALPASVRDSIERLERATASCTGCVLCLAINYGSRAEIAAACRRIAEDVAAGRLEAAAVDERAVAERLDTAGLPDPDLLIRTAGEMRLSNYLLWQISYAELYVTETLWPDFDEAGLHEAIRAFAARDRRFGGLSG